MSGCGWMVQDMQWSNETMDVALIIGWTWHQLSDMLLWMVIYLGRMISIISLVTRHPRGGECVQVTLDVMTMLETMCIQKLNQKICR